VPHPLLDNLGVQIARNFPCGLETLTFHLCCPTLVGFHVVFRGHFSFVALDGSRSGCSPGVLE
jgi:hypothetical protein